MSEKIYLSKKSSEIQDELEAMDADFIQRPYQESHKVSNFFWEEQRAAVLNRVGQSEKTKVSVIKNYRRLFYLNSAAAGLLLLIWLSSETQEVAYAELNLDSIELSALEEYLLDEAGSLDVGLSLEETFYDQELWINEGLQYENND
ncbi:MAG: hypothetical protein ACI9FN_001591 [Saprospiraceae bacterium]|jgi:hypothetical protein